MADFTVILPHKRNAGNDAALNICLSCLYTNTANDFKLVMDAARNEPLYERVNRMVKQADTNYCIYLASDMFVSWGWDIPMVEAMHYRTFVTGVVVEPGVMSVHERNVTHDFGRKPETFRRDEFEHWCIDAAPMPAGEGWYCPYMFARTRFLELGGLSEYGYKDDHNFTNADEVLFNKHKKDGGVVTRVKSYAYHLQRYSEESMQGLGQRG